MPPPLIPRKTFFDNPDRQGVKLSHDGVCLSWLAPLDGVMNVWVAPRDHPEEAIAITHDSGRGIRFYFWAHNNRDLLYLQDEGGDENWRLFAVDRDTQETRNLTPFDQVRAEVKAHHHDSPNTLIIGLNHRDPQWHDLYRIDLQTGHHELLLENNRFSQIIVDPDCQPRIAMHMTSDGGLLLYLRQDNDWQPWLTIPPEDCAAFSIQEFGPEADTLYLFDPRNRDTAAFVELNLTTGVTTLLAEDPKADAAGMMLHPITRQVEAVSFVYQRKRWEVLDPNVRADLDFLAEKLRGEINIVSRTLAHDYWIIEESVDNGPSQFFLYHRPERHLTFLFTNRSSLEGLPLVSMHSFVMQARDGLEMVGYYSLPPGSDPSTKGKPDHPLPMVFHPHGGPWHRDQWGFNSIHQWLANRGYAVLMINFRASTGFGKAFINAGDREWGGNIIDDQVDAVRWAIDAGIADPERIAIMGGSFGGFSVLAGLTFHPELYTCGVDLVGVANLVTWMETIPPYWKPMLDLIKNRVGDPETEEGRRLLEAHSPINAVDQIQRPLLVAQGANDPRVVKAESDQIVEAMQAKGLPVTYLLYPDEGHGFARPPNNLSFFAVAEAFLARFLDGTHEPVGDDLEGASIQFLAGKEEVPGLPTSE